MRYLMGTGAFERPPLARWECVLVAILALMSLGMGLSYLHVPALWHDELVHVFVAQNIVDEGRPELPSGHFYTSGTTFNYLLAGFIALFGSGEFAVRLPSVLIGALNVPLLFALTRFVLGRPVALVAAFFFALSPWHIAWMREARFYELHLAAYLVFVWTAWYGLNARHWQRMIAWGMASLAVYVLGIFTSFQSVIFAATPGAFLLVMFLIHSHGRRRWFVTGAALAVPAALSFVLMYLLLPTADWKAIFEMGGFGGQLVDVSRDYVRSARWFYLRWLEQNLGTGFLVLAICGSVALPLREGRRGLYIALAFWAPLLVLTFLVGYRRARFMYFVYPFYVIAFSYAIVLLARFMATSRQSAFRGLAAVLILIFFARLGVSTAKLIGDTIHTAQGAHVSLERRHPQWREPCQYVRENLDGHAVISTTYLPVLYYVGQCDEWYPSRKVVWEYIESGSTGLKDIADLRDFMDKHPRGFFLADHLRFGVWADFHPDLAFVREHMRFVPQASNRDIRVYEWPK